MPATDANRENVTRKLWPRLHINKISKILKILETIIKYSELWEYVENDTKEHNIKKIAELFLSAMLDWPRGHDLISSYVKEFENYFGKPLTIEKITSVKFDNNAWEVEAGSSIIEMIEISKLYFREENFENIVQIIFDYYKYERASG